MQVVPIRRFEEVVVEYGVSILQGIMGQTSHSDLPAANSGLSSIGEVRLIPDLSTKITLPWYFVPHPMSFLSSSFFESMQSLMMWQMPGLRGPASLSARVLIGEWLIRCRCPEDALVFVNMHEKPGLPWKYCPRNTLQRLSQTLRMSFNLVRK